MTEGAVAFILSRRLTIPEPPVFKTPLFTLIFFLSSLLAGCAGVSVNPGDVAGTHGYVFSDCTALLPPECSLIVKNLKDGQEYAGIALQDGSANGLGVWVPAGRYHLVMHGDPEAFDVQPGQMVGVGTLVAVSLGGYQSMSVPVINADFERHAREVQRAMSPHIKSIAWVNRTPAKPLPVSTERYPQGNVGLVILLLSYYESEVNKPPKNERLSEAKSTAELFEIAKQVAVPLTDRPAIDQQGALYFGGALGQIRKRAPDGRWSSIDTGTLRNLSAVYVNGSTLVAGTDAGALQLSQDGGKTWTTAATVPTRTSVVGIHRIASRWFVAASYRNILVHDPTRWDASLYVADKADLSDLRLVKTVPGAMSSGGEVTPHGYYFHASPQLYLVDPASLNFTSLNVPTEISHFSANADVIGALKAMGVFSKLYVSKDRGKTWLQKDYPPYAVQAMHFNNDGTAIATRWSASAFTAALHTHRYDPATDKWDNVDEAPYTCKRILWDRDATPRYCVDSGGSILRREGQAWVPEFGIANAPAAK